MSGTRLRLAESPSAYDQSRKVRLATQPNIAVRLIEGLHGTLANRPAKWILAARAGGVPAPIARGVAPEV